MSDQTPPHDLHAEAACLGAVLLSGEALDDVRAAGLRPEHFYRPAHAAVWEAVELLDDRGDSADTVTVAAAMTGDALDQLGGHDALLGMVTDTPATSNAAHYAQLVIDCRRRRELIAVAAELRDAAHAGTDTAELIARLDTATAAEASGLVTGQWGWLAVEPAGDRPAPALGLIAVDQRCWLLAPPGTGKTWMMLAAAVEAAAAGRRTLIIDGESGADRLRRRLDLLAPLDAWGDHIDAVDAVSWAASSPSQRRRLLEAVDWAAVDAASSTGAGITDDDYATWHARHVAPALDTDRGLLVLDHPRKRAAGEDRAPAEPRGSGRKLQDADMILSLSGRLERHRRRDDPSESMTTGGLRVCVTKDRDASIPSLEGDCAGVWHLFDDPDRPGGLAWTLAPAEPADLSGLAARVAAAAAGQPGCSKRAIADAAGLSIRATGSALVAAELAGLVRVERSGRSWSVWPAADLLDD